MGKLQVGLDYELMLTLEKIDPDFLFQPHGCLELQAELDGGENIIKIPCINVSSLMKAAYIGNPIAVNALISYSKPNDFSAYKYYDYSDEDEDNPTISLKTRGWNALMYAAHKGSVSCCNLLVSKANISVNLTGTTTSYLDNRYGDSTIDDLNFDEVSALWIAANQGHGNAIMYFLDAGADPNFLGGPCQESILMASVRAHHREKSRTPSEKKELWDAINRLLLISDLDLENNSEKTILWIATTLKHVPLARYLLSKGCNPNIESSSGEKLFDLAINSECEEIQDLYIEYWKANRAT